MRRRRSPSNPSSAGSLSTGRGFLLSAAYVLAMAGAYGVLGIFAAWFGGNLQLYLQTPLAAIYGGASPIKVGLRSGDTSPSERQRQFTSPPHILLTTPESLAILLSQQRWIPALSTVRWIIVDEVPA